MAKAENGSHDEQSFLRKVGTRLGIIPTPSQLEAQTNSYQELARIQRERDLYREKLLEALLHSDACTGEIDYMLGISSEDPHPNHQIVYDPKFPPPEIKQSK